MQQNLANSPEGQQGQFLLTQEEFQGLSEVEQQQYLHDLKMGYYPDQFMPIMGEEEFEMIEQQQNPQWYMYQQHMPPPVFEVKKEQDHK